MRLPRPLPAVPLPVPVPLPLLLVLLPLLLPLRLPAAPSPARGFPPPGPPAPNTTRARGPPPPPTAAAAANRTDALLTRISSLLRDLPTLKAAVIGACAFTSFLIACLLLRVFRSGKRIKKTRKYDIITTPAERVEMAPLNEEDDDEEDSTVFDVKYSLYRNPLFHTDPVSKGAFSNFWPLKLCAAIKGGPIGRWKMTPAGMTHGKCGMRTSKMIL
ncbi:membrane protein FAM174B [Tachyglossus aculeatus]|uniref:membrane protein FAM174B n=1 Tax=Tachyglossus aculeatus TaxID=9261 RepID=UPI0018F353D7|nr:membrane protein FAM174B [Tachyglossus aculeatus]